jgi:dihydrofolate synthase/folylpolyglutamate synthase
MKLTLGEWLQLLEKRHPVDIDLGLERCGQVWARMGNPRPAHRAVTVAGTNGKGSAVAWLEALLREAGRNVACYTSPHILHFNERLRINGRAVSDAELCRAFEAVELARQGTSLTYFEFTTLACFRIMAEAGLDLALLEVGLGGRLDTVNLVDADLAIIMPVGLDHQQFLGEDRETIGREKAGVIRAGQALVLAEAAPPDSVLERAREAGARLVRAGSDFRIQAGPGKLIFTMGNIRSEMPELPLPGAHQRDNLAASLAAFCQLEPDLAMDQALLGRAVSRVRLPGRLMAFAEDPRILVDVGHNPLAAVALAAYLSEQTGPRAHCVLGMLADKDAETVASVLGPVVEVFHCAGLGGPRGQSGDALATRVTHALPGARIEHSNSVAMALEQARSLAASDQPILVFGSFETAGAALRALGVDLLLESNLTLPDQTNG